MRKFATIAIIVDVDSYTVRFPILRDIFTYIDFIPAKHRVSINLQSLECEFTLNLLTFGSSYGEVGG